MLKKLSKQAQATLYISLAIGTLIGVIFLPVFVDLIDSKQSIVTGVKQQLEDTSFNQTFTLANDDIVPGSETVVNATCNQNDCASSPNSTLRSGFEYELNDISGVLKIINRSGTWNVTYNYEPDTYIDSAVGRTVILTVTLLFAVGLIVMIAGGFGAMMDRK